MRKRAAVLILSAALLLAGCGNNAKVIEGEVKTSGDENSEETAQEGGEETSEEAAAGQEAAHKGYVFIYNDIVMEMDAEASAVLEQLGEANSYFEAPSCAFEGIDKMYTYGSFELDTYPTGDKDYISAVIFKDDTITTPEGVGIGDSREKLTEAYGDGGSEEAGMIVYRKDDMKLCFIIQDDSIASIEYRSTVLDE